MMDAAALIARMDEQRSFWVDLGGKKRVKVRRPLEADFHRLRAGITIEHVGESACDWDGFTEADLLGAAVGASDAVPFDGALWARVARDNVAYAAAVSSAIVEAVTAHLAAQEALAKN